MNDTAVARSARWVWLTLAYLATIYASLPVTFPAWRWLAPRARNREGGWLIAASVIVALALLARTWLVSERRRLAALAVVAATAVAYALLFATVLRERAVLEKVHLIEYGVLAFLALNAATARLSGRSAAIAAAGFVLLAGVGDEAIQGLLPNRFFDLHDIAWNWAGGAFGAVVWIAASAYSPWRRVVAPRRSAG